MPIGLTDLRVRSSSHAHRSDSTGRSNAFSREISQIAPRIGLSAGVVRSVCVRGRSDSQICEAVGVRKSCDLSESPISLTDLRVRSASEESTASHAHGLTDLRVRSERPSRTRPHRFESPIGLSRTPGGRSDSTGRSNAFSREISQTAPRMTASPGVRERPIGLSNL